MTIDYRLSPRLFVRRRHVLGRSHVFHSLGLVTCVQLARRFDVTVAGLGVGFMPVALNAGDENNCLISRMPPRIAALSCAYQASAHRAEPVQPRDR